MKEMYANGGNKNVKITPKPLVSIQKLCYYQLIRPNFSLLWNKNHQFLALIKDYFNSPRSIVLGYKKH